jgi:signal transduction histidine kinase
MALVSLVLVVASTGGALYLRALHVEVSRVLVENVDSTLAAKDLETTVTEMIRQLRGRARPLGPGATTKLAEQLTMARQQLQRTLALANHEEERERVGEIGRGLDAYATDWEQGLDAPALCGRLDKDVLPACRDLLNYNSQQVANFDSDNRRIVALLTGGLLLVGIGAPLGGLLLGYAMARRVHQSIYQLSVRVRDAAGRLNGETRAVTLEDTGDGAGLEGHMQNIVEEVERVFQRLQQREREVLRAEQLAAVGQVAAGVAHELRNPLTSVKMLVQTGLEGAAPPGLQPDDLAIIEHEIRRMEACIQTFLDFARPPSSERRRTDLVAVVRRAAALVEGRVRRQHVSCAVDVPARPIELLIDGEQIHQVLVNLLLNALDALPHGGKVRVEVHDPTPEEPSVVARVLNDGPGIPPAIKARLFEPFVSGKETGLGLGLSICRRLVEAHGGTIRGENLASGGVVFTFTLPVEKSPSGTPLGV